MEDRPADARAEYDAALAVLVRNPCPTLEWKILWALAGVLNALRLPEDEALARARARAKLESLADSLSDQRLRRLLLSRFPNRRA
jgi:hypothetical protein